MCFVDNPKVMHGMHQKPQRPMCREHMLQKHLGDMFPIVEGILFYTTDEPSRNK
jgi:hypothetical protein